MAERTTTARGLRARAEVLDAARWLLLERGLDRFSLREVARRAGYAPSALYNHFRDKDDLVIALAMESVSTLAAALSAVPDGDPSTRLRALARAYVGFARQHPDEYQVIFDCLQNPPHTWEQYAAVAHPFALIVAACEEGVSEGVFTPGTGGALGMAYALWAAVAGHVHLQSKHLAAVVGPFDDLLDSAIDALLRGYSIDLAPTGTHSPNATQKRKM